MHFEGFVDKELPEKQTPQKGALKPTKPYTEFTLAAYSSFCNSVPCTVLNKPYTVLALSAIGNTPAKHRSKAQQLNT